MFRENSGPSTTVAKRPTFIQTSVIHADKKRNVNGLYQREFDHEHLFILPMLVIFGIDLYITFCIVLVYTLSTYLLISS